MKFVGVLAMSAVVMGPVVAQASGLALRENSGSGQGSAFAGASAAAEDISYMYHNPAGITRHGGENFDVIGTAIVPKAEFTSTSATTVLTGTIGGGNGGSDVGPDSIAPAIFYSKQLSDRMFIGASLTVPFGLSTEYEPGWVGRYHALKSKITTYNFNPVIAYKATDKLSVAGGLQISYTHAFLSNAVDFGTYDALPVSSGGLGGAFGGTPTEDDGVAEVEGDDYTYGFNLGLLYEFSPTTRVGAAYRSMLHNNLEGPANFYNGTLGDSISGSTGVFVRTEVQATVNLPEVASFGVYHEVSDRLALMGEVAWTGWSRLQELRVQFANAQPDSVTVSKWRDTWFFAVGAHYKLDGGWLLRGGVAYDQSPVPDATRTPRVPDEDRKWISIGARYQISSDSYFDFGYTRLVFDDASLQLSTAEPSNGLRGNLSGKYKISTDILALQYRLAF